MLEIKFVRQNLNLVKEATLSRGVVLDWDFLKSQDILLRTMISNLELMRHTRNSVTDEIAVMKKNGKDIGGVVSRMRSVSLKIKLLQDKVLEQEKVLSNILMSIPNIAHSSTPFGTDEKNNLVLRTVGLRPEFDFMPLSHWVLGEKLGLFDFKRASKIVGARFPLFTGVGARMERALISLMLDVHIDEHNYYEILPPLIVNSRSLLGTGQLPKFKTDLFKIEGRDVFLIPTAEVPVTNMFRDEVLDEGELPICYVAYSPCFRAEAGSYGRDSRGLIRQHQFDKVELIKFSHPETSYIELESLLEDAEKILRRLGLHYRVVDLCRSELGFSASKTYDIEVWMPYQKKYKEISSCSNFEDFQARRSNIRFRRNNKKGTYLVHTLNGSGLAVGRTMAAILENYQDGNGGILIPEALRSYMGGLSKVSAKQLF